MQRSWMAIVVLSIALPAAAAGGKCPSEKLRHPVQLAASGEGYLIPPTWAKRGLRYGTKTLIGVIERAARRVAKARPGALLYVADLSRRTGGASEWHRSHKTGRDVDLLFYAIGPDGAQAPPPREMVRFSASGLAVVNGKKLEFDTARNWMLVKSILQDRARIEKIFVSEGLKRRLLIYAKKKKESAKLIALAEDRLGQPSDSAAHDDHFHVRVACSAGDVPKVIKKKKPKQNSKQVHAREQRKRGR